MTSEAPSSMSRFNLASLIEMVITRVHFGELQREDRPRPGQPSGTRNC